MKKLVIIALCALCIFANAQSTNSNKMFNLLAKFTVKPESISVFKAACIHSLTESRKEAGNIEMKLFADDNKDNVFYVYSRWDNKAAYEFHTTLPHSKNIAKVAKANLAKAPEITSLGLTSPATVRGTKQVNPEDREETLFFIFKINEDYREGVIKRFETHVMHSRKEEGNLLFEFYTVEGDANTFVVYENWRSNSALTDIHLKTPYSEETGSLLSKAMIGDMNQYMNFVTELEPNTSRPLKRNWEVKGFAMPESVVADPNSDWLYISNIDNRGTPGYISRVSKSGKVDTYNWLEGLNQPCGLAIFGNKLYVGDQDKVHIIDIANARIIKSISADGALTLNDVAIDKNGKVYISDVVSGRIYTIENDSLIVWVENQLFAHPNGLYADEGYLIVAELGPKLSPDASPEIPGSVYRINIATKNVELIKPAYELGSLDGISKVGNKYIVTNNSGGELYAISEKERILLGSLSPGIADLCAEGQTIYIPNFEGTVRSFTLKSETKSPPKKGTFELINFDEAKLHVYQTKDLMTDYVFILEKAGKAALLKWL